MLILCVDSLADRRKPQHLTFPTVTLDRAATSTFKLAADPLLLTIISNALMLAAGCVRTNKTIGMSLNSQSKDVIRLLFVDHTSSTVYEWME